MMNTSRMIPAIESDRTGRPWVEFGGDKLNGIDISECALALPLWDMSGIYHVHYFDLRWKFLLSPCVRLAKFILVFSLRSLSVVYGVELAGLLEDPTTTLAMVRMFIWGAMDLVGPI